MRDGYLWSNGRPGLGIEFDEAEAAKYPTAGITAKPVEWTQTRWPDGRLLTP